MTRFHAALAAFALAGAAFTAGRWSVLASSKASASPTSPNVEDSIRDENAQTRRMIADLRFELRAAVGSQGKPLIDQRPSVAEQAAPQPPSEALPTPGESLASEKADRLLGSAKQSGRWTAEHVMALREAMTGMTNADRSRASLALVQLINEGKVRPDGPQMF